MILKNLLPKSLLFLLFVFSMQGLMAQDVKLVELPEMISLDIQAEKSADVDWGQVEKGTMVRAKAIFTNSYASPIKLLRVITGEDCRAIGNNIVLRDVMVKPGEKVMFFLMPATAEAKGEINSQIELILEIEGKRQRRAVFNFHGIIGANTAE